ILGWWAWRETAKKAFLTLFYAFIAFGMLAKGPVAPLLALLVILVYAAAVRNLRLIRQTLWLPGILLFCAISSPWYFAVQLRNPQFFREFILEHNLGRFSKNLYHHTEPFWYYLPVAALALVPWTIFTAASLFESVRQWRSKLAPAEVDLTYQFSLF